MVGLALKPHYHAEKVSKNQYTDINRNVSRMLYERAGNIASLDQAAREKWERIAREETSKAVLALKNDAATGPEL